MNQVPPALPLPIAHTMKMNGNLYMFNDSGAARPPAPPLKPCKCIEMLIFLMNQGPLAPPLPVAHTMKMNANFN